MGVGIARVGDMGLGICPKHKSPKIYNVTFVSGAATVNTNGLSTTNLTTIGVATCAHPTVVISVSATVSAEGTGVHRLGDSGINYGSYTVISSSGNVNSG
jgi:uncharacterized Zn-binding protein involved in type VI secretion